MKKIILSILIALACKLSMGQKLVQTYYDWNKIHPKEVYYVNLSGQKSGAYKMYNETGIVIKEYNFLNGAENGLCIDYAVTRNNQKVVSAKGSFINGQPDGAYVQYCDEDGYKSKVQEGRYKNGKKTGKWKEWWCTNIFEGAQIGQKQYVNVLKSAGVYKDGQYDSIWSFYNKRGLIEKSIRYRNGVRDGQWTKYIYNNDGTLNKKGICTGDDAVESDSKKNGLWYTYFTDGVSVYEKGEYNDGHKWGKWFYYLPSDSTKIANSGEYIYDRHFGEWKIYFTKDLDAIYVPLGALYYRVLVFDSSGTPVGNARDFNISGEKLWEGPVTAGDAFEYKH